MDMLYLKSLLMGIVEGLTEFLPISSTGHLILTGSLLGLTNEKVKVFEIVIQTGAVLAIVWEFRKKFIDVALGLLKREKKAVRFTANLVIAFLPAAIVGLALHHIIKEYLFKPLPVAAAFIVGALIIIWVERRERKAQVDDVDDMSWKDALKVGCAQCLGLIPGTSRSGATIIGGMLFAISRRAATEFSFFLAVPTLFAAAAYDLFKNRDLLSAADTGWFAVGFIASFISALLCVRWLLRFISTHNFTPFAWYRIAFGLVILATAALKIVDWTAN